MRLQVSFLDEETMDQYGESGRFCRIYERDEIPENFVEKHYEANGLLEDILMLRHGEKYVYINHDMNPAHQLLIEITSSILDEALLHTLFQFLNAHAKEYCVYVSVYDFIEFPDVGAGKRYVGRVMLNLREIAVEETLKKLWERKIGLIELKILNSN